MKGKRTGLDFSEHEVLVTKSDELLIHHLKKPNSYYDSIKYINTQGIMAVTGDYGNWIFCREFHPSPDGYVSGGYWCEKLSIASCQVYDHYDSEATTKEIKYRLDSKEYEDYSSEEEREAYKEFLEDSLNHVDDEVEYTHFVFRERPDFLDYETTIFKKELNVWLPYIFDGFEEICRRMKENEA